MWKLFAKEVNEGHKNQPRKDAAGKDNSCHLRSNDVPHAKIFRRCIGLDRGALQNMSRSKVWLKLRGTWPCFEDVLVLEERVQSAQTQAKEDTAGQGAALFTGDQHVGASRSLGIGQVAVFFDNQLTTQRNHEEHAKPTPDQ